MCFLTRHKADTERPSAMVPGPFEIDFDLVSKNEQNDTTNSISDTYGIIDNLLQGLNTFPAYYDLLVSESSVDLLDIQVRMLFRAFKPHLLRIEHPELLERLPVFEMASIRDTVYIQSSQ